MSQDLPKGIYLSGINCGIKQSGKDLAFFYIPEAYSTAAVFTKNHFAADCVVSTRNHISQKALKAFIVNSGNANAVTPNAADDNKKIIESIAEELSINPEEIGIASTGIIGVPLPVDKILSGFSEICKQLESTDFNAAAEAILTTDTVIKTFHSKTNINGHDVIISGMAKGSGMIAPNMATMLCYLFINVAVEQDRLQKLLSDAVNDSFNMISVDTDTSTNDMVVAFTTSEVKLDQKQTENEFYSLLYNACEDLAKQIIRDGEGATKLIEVKVENAKSIKEAKAIAKSIADSPLVKTAIHGADPNWGRIAMAIGKVENVSIDQNKVDIDLQNLRVLEQGNPIVFDRQNLIDKLKVDNIFINVNLSLGNNSATAWGCDLSHKYVDINVDYN